MARKKVLMVVRNCCEIGNCSSCISVEGHKYGQTVLVCQFVTTCTEMAHRVAFSWQRYGSQVIEATEANINRLRKISQDYVREKLLKPHMINDHVFGVGG
jgi:hypothetical protein